MMLSASEAVKFGKLFVFDMVLIDSGSLRGARRLCLKL